MLAMRHALVWALVALLLSLVLLSPIQTAFAGTAVVDDAEGTGCIKLCYFYFGNVDDLGWTYTFNQGRLKYVAALRKQANSTTRCVVHLAFLDVFFATDKEAVVAQAINEYNCSAIVANNALLLGERPTATAARFPNIKFFVLDITHAVAARPTEDSNLAFFSHRTQSAFYAVGMAAARVASQCVAFVAAYLAHPNVEDSINGFILGVRKVNPTLPIHIVPLESWTRTDDEWLATEILVHRFNCEVVARYTDTSAVDSAIAHYVAKGKTKLLPSEDAAVASVPMPLATRDTSFASPSPALEAAGAGGKPSRMSVGVHSDVGEFVGDSVLLSVLMDWSPALADMLDPVVAKMGGVPSVPAATTEVRDYYLYDATRGLRLALGPRALDVATEFASFSNGTNTTPFCGALTRTDGSEVKMPNGIGSCLSPQENVRGILKGAELHTVFESPSVCSAGTRATYPTRVPLRVACIPCPRGSYSQQGALQCTQCPVGTDSADGSAVCWSVAVSRTTLVSIIGGTIAVGLTAFVVYAVHTARRVHAQAPRTSKDTIVAVHICSDISEAVPLEHRLAAQKVMMRLVLNAAPRHGCYCVPSTAPNTGPSRGGWWSRGNERGGGRTWGSAKTSVGGGRTPPTARSASPEATGPPAVASGLSPKHVQPADEVATFSGGVAASASAGRKPAPALELADSARLGAPDGGAQSPAWFTEEMSALQPPQLQPPPAYGRDRFMMTVVCSDLVNAAVFAADVLVAAQRATKLPDVGPSEATGNAAVPVAAAVGTAAATAFDASGTPLNPLIGDATTPTVAGSGGHVGGRINSSTVSSSGIGTAARSGSLPAVDRSTAVFGRRGPALSLVVQSARKCTVSYWSVLTHGALRYASPDFLAGHELLETAVQQRCGILLSASDAEALMSDASYRPILAPLVALVPIAAAGGAMAMYPQSRAGDADGKTVSIAAAIQLAGSLIVGAPPRGLTMQQQERLASVLAGAWGITSRAPTEDDADADDYDFDNINRGADSEKVLPPTRTTTADRFAGEHHRVGGCGMAVTSATGSLVESATMDSPTASRRGERRRPRVPRQLLSVYHQMAAAMRELLSAAAMQSTLAEGGVSFG